MASSQAHLFFDTLSVWFTLHQFDAELEVRSSTYDLPIVRQPSLIEDSNTNKEGAVKVPVEYICRYVVATTVTGLNLFFAERFIL